MLLIANFATILPALSKNISLRRDSVKTSLKFKDNRPNRPVYFSALPTKFEPLTNKTSIKLSSKSLSTSNKTLVSKNISNVNLEQVKPLDNVKIYPNPVSNQINLTYSLKKESIVTVKIMDLLGNEVLVLMSKKMDAGEQYNKFLIETKLSSGFYFVRLSAGSDSIIKRISVL
jgi:hypothetical protein